MIENPKQWKGTEKIVTVFGDFVKLEGERKWDLERAKSIFHLATIAHLLFPKNIPTPISINKNENGDGYFILVEKIKHDKIHAKIESNKRDGFMSSASIEDYEPIEEEVSFVKLKEKLREAGFTKYEIKGYNIIKDENDVPIFVDFEPALYVLPSGSKHLLFEPDKLYRHINEKLEGYTKKLALDNFYQIFDIFDKEERKKMFETFSIPEL
jgi:hypothetical protein